MHEGHINVSNNNVIFITMHKLNPPIQGRGKPIPHNPEKGFPSNCHPMLSETTQHTKAKNCVGGRDTP